MGTFKKTTVTKGQFKGIIATGDGFMDDESGELINLSQEIRTAMGDNPVEITVSLKQDEEV